jgi:hypothetical protein
MNLEQSLTQHYAQGSLQQAIFNALLASGKDVSRLEQADLAPVDEFHIGSRRATTTLPNNSESSAVCTCWISVVVLVALPAISPTTMVAGLWVLT